MAIKKFIVGSFETNTYLITKGDKAVVVDPGLDIESILPELTNYEIEAILITHAHIDHIDGVEYFNAPIYVLEPDLLGFKDMTFSLYQLCYQKPSFNYQNLRLIGVKDNEIITLPNFTFKVLAVHVVIYITIVYLVVILCLKEVAEERTFQVVII